MENFKLSGYGVELLDTRKAKILMVAAFGEGSEDGLLL